MKSKLFSLIALASLWGAIALAVLLPAGKLDPKFGPDKTGMIRTAQENKNLWTSAAVLQSDGKIVVAGYSYGNGQSFDSLLVRYNPDGSIDFSKTENLNGLVEKAKNPEGSDAIQAVALQGEKIVVAGYVTSKNDRDEYFQKLILARFNADGSLDKNFGNQGIADEPVDVPGNHFATAIAIQSTQPDGKIIVVGQYEGPAIWVIEYNLDGKAQKSRLFAPSVENNENIPYAVQIQPDGKILIAGMTSDHPSLIRLNPDLSSDSEFGKSQGDVLKVEDGVLILSKFGEFRSLEIQNDKILAGGSIKPDPLKNRYAFTVFGCADANCTSYDQNFGPDGFSTYNFDKDDKGNPASNDQLRSLKIQVDGNIVATGISQPIISDRLQDARFGTVRFNINGTIDSTFGENGRVFSSFTENDLSASSYPAAVLLQPNDKKIVVAGVSGNSLAAISLARYFGVPTDPDQPAPSVNPNKNGGGCAIASFGNFDLFAFALWLIPFGLLGWRRVRKEL